MNGIFKTFTDIMIFKKGPQDMPSSQGLLNFFIVINILISFIPNDINYDFKISLITSLVYVGASLFFIQTILNVKENMSQKTGYRIRYVQTATTILGTHAVIGFITSMIFYLLHNQDFIFIIIFVATLYSWLLYGHIFKNSLDCTMFLGLSMSFLYSMILGFILILILSFLI